MSKSKRIKTSYLFGLVATIALCLGIAVSVKPVQTVKAAQTMSANNWTVVLESSDNSIRIQNGTMYWTTGEGTFVTPDSIMNYTEVNGKTLAQINAENPGAINVTLQAPGGSIGSFFRVNVNSSVANFTVKDFGTLVVRAGWSHTDSSGTYTIDTDLYFACKQNGGGWTFVTEVVDVSDMLVVSDQGELNTNSRTILVKTGGTMCWSNSPATPNEGNGTLGGPFLNTIYINGSSIKEWNTKAYKMLENGEISDITFGAQQDNIKNGAPYAPILVLNGTADGLGSIFQTWVPTGYIDRVSSFKIAKGFGNLQGTTLYYVAKDVEYVRSGSSFVKVASIVDITDDLKIRSVQSLDNGTTLYYIGGKDDAQKWTQVYGESSMAINEYEWKGGQGGAVQMSYLALNGNSLYDINVNDNGAYGATQGNIVSGGKYAPILAFVTATEIGGAIKIQVPNAYPSGSGTATANHKTIAVLKGFYVLDSATNIKYEVNKDVQWDYQDGEWVEHVNLIETSVTDARIFLEGNTNQNSTFAGIALAGSDYSAAPNTYSGTVKTAKSYARSANFLSHVLIDDVPLTSPGEAFLNVWNNFGYFTFRPGNNAATKITILAGCQFPTYKALLTGEKEAYVTTEDITFVKDANGN